jgi:hypothetical protein
MVSLNSFLRWAIPKHYPDVSSLNPVEALIAYFGDPPLRRGEHASRSYNAVQLHMRRYLESVSPEERMKLTPFLFPLLIDSPQLSRLRVQTTRKGEEKRKEQTFAVVKDLHALIMMARQRYQWLVDLDQRVQQIAKSIENQSIILPVTLSIRDLDDRQDLTFRVWNRMSWLEHHRKGYSWESLRDAKQDFSRPEYRRGLFLQLAGPLPDTVWFLHAAELGALCHGEGNKTEIRQREKYFRDCNMPPFKYAGKRLIRPDHSLAQTLAHARRVADGTPEDSRVVFCVEPLLGAAAVGLFALVCLTQSGMRIGELQQVSLDKECMKIANVPTFDEKSGRFGENSTRLFFWLLYPKGSTERQHYPVTPYMQEAMTAWIEMHERFCGQFKEVPPDRNDFKHARRFLGKHKFLFQWNGKHLGRQIMEACLDVLLLEHFCLDSSGRRTRITSHVLRHGVAGYLRQQGIPLEDIAGLLHQVNLVITDYYSKPSPQDLFAKVGPALTRLGDLAEIDPSTLRTVGDIQRLGQEALKRFGVLRHIPGGTCAVFTSCEVQFKCAGCPSYIPDPTRADEVREKISSCARTAQFLQASGDYLQAEVQRAHGRQWERIAKEMQALATIKLASPPFENALKEFGIDNLDEVDDEWLLTLKRQPRLSSGGNGSHG